MTKSRTAAGAVPLLGLCCVLVVAACRRADEGMEQGLRLVTLPDVDGLPKPARAQLQAQREELRTLLSKGDVDRVELGEAYGRMGQLLLAYDLDEAAEPALKNAADLLSDDLRWAYYLGHLYVRGGVLEAAARQFQRAIAISEEDVPTRLHLAELYIDMGREGEAKRVLEETVRIEPSSAAAHFLLGQLASGENPSEAIARYETVLRLQPKASVVHYPLALAYQKQGDLERSREHLAQRGDTYISVSDPLLRELERLRRGAEAMLFQGSALMRQQRYREAATAFLAAIAADSLNLAAYVNLGAAYARLGESQLAMGALARALQLDPSNSIAHYNLGRLFRDGGDEEKARGHFEAAVEADANNTGARFALASILWSRGACLEAIPHLAAYLEANPANVEVRIKGVICHAYLEEYAEALELLQAGYEALPNEPLLQDAMVRLLAASPDEKVRDGERAVRIAESLAASFRRPETLESLAMAYAEVGRISEAIEIQRQVIRAAEEQDLTDVLAHLHRNLRRYEGGEPSRAPWPPSVFER